MKLILCSAYNHKDYNLCIYYSYLNAIPRFSYTRHSLNVIVRPWLDAEIIFDLKRYIIDVINETRSYETYQ